MNSEQGNEGERRFGEGQLVIVSIQIVRAQFGDNQSDHVDEHYEVNLIINNLKLD